MRTNSIWLCNLVSMKKAKILAWSAILIVNCMFVVHLVNKIQTALEKCYDIDSQATTLNNALIDIHQLERRDVQHANATTTTLSGTSAQKTYPHILPYTDLHWEWIKKNVSRKSFLYRNISLLSAFEYADQIAIMVTTENLYSEKVYCHYYDSKRKSLNEPYEAFIFPESIAYCMRKHGARFVSLTEQPNDTPNDPIPLIDRTSPGK
ncbi:hypothetical protein WR25_15649 [Diploscapter pachys]|uniref:Uncharacterized protein n=1 Tax=Diploscapter pachys TaxID=2018661 RepID=A0A2A2KUQ8_9BILA|nr:hypothetical protein WR25_15649 [Diploscapter pachys]